MRIFDCFIFNHEIDILEIRLNILDEYVDKFIITEGDVTFSGLPKESYFLKNKKRFSKWEDKIILNSITIPEFKSPWDREIYSRNSIKELDIFKDDDLIITSDCDEIPNPEVLKHSSEWVSDDTQFTFQQNCYYYWLNNLYSEKWFGSRATTYKYMKNTTVDDIREGTEDESKITGSVITNGGWHFSYCGGQEVLTKKIQSYSHTELNTPKVVENISESLESGTDYVNKIRNVNCRVVEFDSSFPQYIINNKEKYSDWIKNYGS